MTDQPTETSKIFDLSMLNRLEKQGIVVKGCGNPSYKELGLQLTSDQTIIVLSALYPFFRSDSIKFNGKKELSLVINADKAELLLGIVEGFANAND